jgi:hypothetical protein
MTSNINTYLLTCFGESADKRVLKEIQEICKDVEGKVMTTNERRHMYKISDEVKHGDGCLNELLVAIEKTFSGCNISLDSSETHITIDWS